MAPPKLIFPPNFPAFFVCVLVTGMALLPANLAGAEFAYLWRIRYIHVGLHTKYALWSAALDVDFSCEGYLFLSLVYVNTLVFVSFQAFFVF